MTETDIRLPIVTALTEDLDTGFVALFDGYRNVVFSAALRLCGRWADAEIATVLGTPEGTVKSHISRGLKRLRMLYPEEAR